MSKFYKCGRCWRKATHSIGFYDNQHHLCNKHWKSFTEAITIQGLNQMSKSKLTIRGVIK